MKPLRAYLALDLGAESGRAVLGRMDNKRITLQEIHRFPNGPIQEGNSLHWDVKRLWEEIQQGISLTVRETGALSFSLGVDTWGVDFALLDKDGLLLGNPFHYRDSRTDGMLEQAFHRVPRAEIFASTGIQFMQLNTLYQLLAMSQTKSPLLKAARTMLTIPDLFNHWLSGSLNSEFTIATTTQCFEPTRRAWAISLMEALNIPTHILPPVCESGSLLGELLPEVAAKTGAGGIPVIAPACHDTGSAVAAVPAENTDFAWLSSGTWSILGAEVHRPVLSEKALAYNFTNEGGVFGTWRLCKNITGLWLVQECKREWNLTYDELTRLAAEARPFLAVIDVDNTVFLHPGNMPEKIRQYCVDTGQPVPQTQGEIIRLVLESLALKYRQVLSQLEELSGGRLDPVHIIGGGTRNGLLNQFTANACRRRVLAGPVEATAIGNILMQAITLGQIGSLEEARSLIRQSFRVNEYNPQHSTGWDEGYARLLKGLN